jgi:nucleotide-binding universal stress UspA family protein
MIKDLIVNLSLADKSDFTLDFAVSVASKFSAHIMGLSIFYEPIFPTVEFDAIPADVIDLQAAENQRLATSAKTRFEEVVRRDSLSGESRIVRETLGTAPDTFARLARRFDLSVVKQPGPDTPGTDSLFVEAALFNSGRPVLVVPYIQRTGLNLDRVMICWDGSRPAARAVADALPFLAQTRTTEIVTVEEKKPDLMLIPGADIAHHLARHGIKVELKNVVASGVDTTNVILSHAADTSANLIIMGGYGHSRFREFVLGGVTRGLLESMTVPTLMSH